MAIAIHIHVRDFAMPVQVWLCIFDMLTNMDPGQLDLVLKFGDIAELHLPFDGSARIEYDQSCDWPDPGLPRLQPGAPANASWLHDIPPQTNFPAPINWGDILCWHVDVHQAPIAAVLQDFDRSNRSRLVLIAHGRALHLSKDPSGSMRLTIEPSARLYPL